MINIENIKFFYKLLICGIALAIAILLPDNSNQSHYPNINIPAGYVLEIDKQPVSVFGEQECNNNLGILYPSINSTSTKDCITILPNTQKVLAFMVVNRQVVEESWTVEQKKEKGIRTITIKRPNGDTIKPFHFNNTN